MASIRRAFTDEFKAVRLVTVEGHSARQVARELGIHESLLRRWQRKLEARQARAAGVKPSATIAASIIGGCSAGTLDFIEFGVTSHLRSK